MVVISTARTGGVLSTLRTHLLGIAILAFGIQSANANYVDLTNKGSGSINQGTFVWADQRSTGSGVIDPFLHIHPQGNPDTESGFNTNFTPLPLDAENPTKAILLSSFGTVLLNGTPSIRFLLDINENLGGNDELLSLDNLQVYVSTNSSIPTLSALQNPLNATLIYDIDTGAPGTCTGTVQCIANASNGVALNAALQTGSGSGDMYFYLPAALFPSNTSGLYLYLYSSFGGLGGGYTVSDGFEEWARVDSPTAVPEPTTYAFVLSLVSSAVVLYKKRRSPESE